LIFLGGNSENQISDVSILDFNWPFSKIQIFSGKYSDFFGFDLFPEEINFIFFISPPWGNPNLGPNFDPKN